MMCIPPRESTNIFLKESPKGTKIYDGFEEVPGDAWLVGAQQHELPEGRKHMSHLATVKVEGLYLSWDARNERYKSDIYIKHDGAYWEMYSPGSLELTFRASNKSIIGRQVVNLEGLGEDRYQIVGPFDNTCRGSAWFSRFSFQDATFASLRIVGKGQCRPKSDWLEWHCLSG
jgi:hypothetical protein